MLTKEQAQLIVDAYSIDVELEYEYEFIQENNPELLSAMEALVDIAQEKC